MQSTPTNILLVRHGATEWTRDDRFCGVSDIDLIAEGEHQAERLALRLAQTSITAVYCSPLRRTRQTAAILAAPHALPPIVVPKLIEMNFGAWEGRLRDEIRANDQARYTAWRRDPVGIVPEDGESTYGVAARALDALTQIVERHQGQTVLIVAHKTVNRIVLCHWLGLPLALYRERIAQDPGALNWIVIGTQGTVQIKHLNDTAHSIATGAD